MALFQQSISSLHELDIDDLIDELDVSPSPLDKTYVTDKSDLRRGRADI